jgi:hypothetical protein
MIQASGRGTRTRGGHPAAAGTVKQQQSTLTRGQVHHAGRRTCSAQGAIGHMVRQEQSGAGVIAGGGACIGVGQRRVGGRAGEQTAGQTGAGGQTDGQTELGQRAV